MSCSGGSGNNLFQSLTDVHVMRLAESLHLLKETLSFLARYYSFFKSAKTMKLPRLRYIKAITYGVQRCASERKTISPPHSNQNHVKGASMQIGERGDLRL